MHFLEAFALKLHIPLEFLMEVEIKPASSSGAVWWMETATGAMGAATTGERHKRKDR